MKQDKSISFCVEETCDYYRKSDDIFCDKDETVREQISEHYSIRHIML